MNYLGVALNINNEIFYFLVFYFSLQFNLIQIIDSFFFLNSLRVLLQLLTE